MNNKDKIALLVIDGQIDFMDLPGSKLPVTGATEDMDRLVDFIKKNQSSIGLISCTLDSHHTLHIAHSALWKDKDGNNVPPFTMITDSDLKAGKYTPTMNLGWCYKYVADLEKQGEYPHFIWPDHCIIGTPGHALYPALSDAINSWERTSMRPTKFVTKGSNPLTEHFGAFRANIEMADDPSTQFNQELVGYLSQYDQVYVAGEARSHCVANTLRQLLQEVPSFVPKLIFLEDCMSDVVGANLPQAFYDGVNAIYAEAKAKGVQFVKSTDPVLQPATV